MTYLEARIAECERTKAAAQAQLTQAQVLHERAEGGRLMLLQLREELAQADALTIFVVALFQGAVGTATTPV